MAEPQPTPADSEDERNLAAKSAEDRKAASALANLDSDKASSSATSAASAAVSQEAVTKAMKNLGGLGSGGAARKNVKVDAADVAILVDQLDMAKPRATEFLKSHDGDAVKAMRAFVSA